jgi:hypothetical protein
VRLPPLQCQHLVLGQRCTQPQVKTGLDQTRPKQEYVKTLPVFFRLLCAKFLVVEYVCQFLPAAVCKAFFLGVNMPRLDPTYRCLVAAVVAGLSRQSVQIASVYCHWPVSSVLKWPVCATMVVRALLSPPPPPTTTRTLPTKDDLSTGLHLRWGWPL